MSTSIVEYFPGKEASRCGYCKGKNSSYSNGMWAHVMTVEDYQDLIDRGWRRSGRYCYKPMMDKTCCPQYTIRTHALEFKPSKSHKKVLKRFRHYIINGKEKSEVFTPPPAKFEHYSDTDESESLDIDPVESNAVDAEKKVKMTSSDQSCCQTEKRMRVSDQSAEAPGEGSSGNSTQVRPEKNRTPKPGQGPDPKKPKARKAKELRRERALKKLESQGKDPPQLKKNSVDEKSLEDFLLEPFPEKSAHRFEMRLVKAQTSSEEFMKTYEESMQVYRKYQVAIHKDAPSKCSPDQFKRFLCNSSLTYRDDPFLDGNKEIAPGYGAFHQQYLIDGKIVCVGVIDILPKCVSSVYLFYDPDYSFLSLGTLTSLFEMSFVRQLAKIRPTLNYYYMGYYIHSCPKMRYKAQYRPTDIVCPVTLDWVPIENCLPVLDQTKFSRFKPGEEALKKNPDMNRIGILYCRQAMQYRVYRSLKFADDDDDNNELEEDFSDVREYAQLAGNEVSRRMLLFRDS